MWGKIGLEEHFAIPETLDDSRGFFPDRIWGELKARLLDLHDERLRLMDEYGIEMMLLSLNAPVVQAIPDPARANDIARKANDYLAREVQKRPDRFQGLAALPMQDPDLAIRELDRCVRDLGFKGVLVNGFSQVGDPRHASSTTTCRNTGRSGECWSSSTCRSICTRAIRSKRDARIYDGHPWLMGPAWAFGQETAVHALRLMGSGLFDEHPKLSIVLGHMGEGLPFSMWRVDNCNAWVEDRHNYPAKRRIADYFSENFYITTSGNFRTQALINAILEIGADRIMFSTDWPFENIDHAAIWFDAATISENDRLKIGRTNAAKLFKLGLS